MHERFGTRETDKEEILPQILKQADENITGLTNNQAFSIQMMRKDNYRREIAKMAMDEKALKDFADDILKRIEGVDLKSYDFSKDADMSFRH